MWPDTAVLALPTADRRRAYAYYGPDGLGLETPGPIADDGVPEPLQVVLNPGLTVMLVPTDGFGFTAAGRTVAGPGTVECQLSFEVADRETVDALAARAAAAGAEVAAGPHDLGWAYVATIADPDGHLMTVLVMA